MATTFAAVKQTKLLARIDTIDWYTGSCYFTVPIFPTPGIYGALEEHLRRLLQLLIRIGHLFFS